MFRKPSKARNSLQNDFCDLTRSHLWSPRVQEPRVHGATPPNVMTSTAIMAVRGIKQFACPLLGLLCTD